ERVRPGRQVDPAEEPVGVAGPLIGARRGLALLQGGDPRRPRRRTARDRDDDACERRERSLVEDAADQRRTVDDLVDRLIPRARHTPPTLSVSTGGPTVSGTDISTGTVSV